jgi:hypothetical protein
MRYKKIISQKWANIYQVREVFLRDNLYQKTLNYLKRQKHLDPNKIKELNKINYNKKFPVFNVLLHKKVIVGFLGTIFSNKFSYKIKYINCNVHSWLVDNNHRIVATLLFEKIMEKNCTITVLSSLPRLHKIFEKMKFQKLIMYYNLIFIKKLDLLKKKNSFTLEQNNREIKKRLDKKNLQISNDHSNKNYVKFVFCKKNEKLSSFIIANIVYKKKYIKTINILYSTNKNFLKKNIQQFYQLVASEFNVLMCGEYILKKKESIFNNKNYINFTKKKEIYLRNKPLKFEFNNLYSELEY